MPPIIWVQAQERFRPSMMQAVNLPRLLAYARKRLPLQRFTTPAAPLPEGGAIPIEARANPDFTLDDFDVALFPPG
jgi:hypothetical protein